jgi:hypothetical protein
MADKVDGVPASVSTMEFPSQAVTFDIDAFDELIRTQGIMFIHWRSTRCPVGMVDQYDMRKPHEDHSGCSNGFLYTEAGEVTCLFTGNSNVRESSPSGYMDQATVQLTLPRFYDRKSEAESLEPIDIAQFDRLYLPNPSITVTHWQLFTSHISGTEKLSFPVVKVKDLIDNQGKRYYPEHDFNVVAGQIVWGDKHPEFGAVCSVRYTYRPYWYVARLLHEIRVSQAENEITGVRETQRLPQAVILNREYVFEKENKDELAPDPNSPRQVKGPQDGIFAPR